MRSRVCTALMNTIKLIKQDLNPDLAIEGVLLTMYDSRNNLADSGGRRKCASISATRCTPPSFTGTWP